MSPSQERIDAAVARILGHRPAPEHWITFLVTGPKGTNELVRVTLRTGEVPLYNMNSLPYVQARLQAIIKAKKDLGLNCWPIRRFDANPHDWSTSVDDFNSDPRP